MQKHIAAVLILLLAGAFQQTLAARQLTAAQSPTSAYTWLPHKNEDNVWQPANLTAVDYSTLTLQDLPSPEIFIQMALQSPYPMPDIPMGLLVNNTLNQWSGGKPPSSAQDWLQLLQGAGSFVTASVPTLMAKFLPNITLQGQTVSVAAETSKLLNSLPFFNNSTSIELPLPENMVGVGVATPTINLTQSVDVTMQILQRLPEMFKKAAELVVGGVRSVDLSGLQSMVLNEEGQLDIPKILSATLNIDASQLPPPPNMSKILADLAQALPVVAQQMGIDTSNIKFPDATAIGSLLQLANGSGLFITDPLGRVDLLATLTQLPMKLPELNTVASGLTQALPPPPQGWPELDKVVSRVAEVTKAVASVAAQLP